MKPDRLDPGQGMVIEKKNEKESIAYYMDEKGELHSYSAVCTHLGCIVKWNDSEKS